MGAKLDSLVYVKLIKLGKDAVAEGKRKAAKQTAVDRPKSGTSKRADESPASGE
jgi:hypothetical protein